MKRRKPAPQPEPLRPMVFRWDLDKTYLKTDFDKLRNLVRIPFERAQDKVDLPGVVPLIRGLKQCGREIGRDVRIHFISASPPQIGAAIRAKLHLDGVEYDDIIFKDQLHNLVHGKFRNLREQVGYKLTELLASRRTMPPDAQEVLFGDDWESDPIIYSIYADVLSGQLPANDLREILQAIHVDPELVQKAVALCPGAVAAVALRIYINLERRTPLANFYIFGARLVPTFNYLQTAACLYEDGHLRLDAVATVAQSLVDVSGLTRERLANSLADIERRGHLGGSAAAAIRAHLIAGGLLAGAPAPTTTAQPWRQRLRAWLRTRSAQLRARLEPSNPVVAPAASPAPKIDYRTLVAEWRSLREGARA